MKGLRAAELRQLSPAELRQKQEALVRELCQLQLKAKTVGVEKPAQFRRLRRDLARVLTVVSEQNRS